MPESPAADSTSSFTPPKRGRFRLRYSLRSLLLFMLLFSAALALWRDWSPWQIEHVLRGHHNAVSSAAFSPDGLRIGTARVWDAETGRELYVLSSHKVSVRSAAFSPDGCRIVAASFVETARIWRRHRPEWWWGVFWLPQFWAAALLLPAFVWSLRRDYKNLIRAIFLVGRQ